MRFIIFLSFIIFLAPHAFAQTLTLTTYYPSPSGDYANLSVTGNLGVGTTTPIAKLHVKGGGAVIGTNGSTSTTRALTILADGQVRLNPGPYAGAWTGALQIQNNNNSRFVWLSPLDSGSSANARLRTAATGFDIYTGGTTANAGVLGLSQNISGCIGIGIAAPAYRLDLNGGTFAYGLGNSRTETRENAGLSGAAGAQSGFFQTSAPVNYPAGAASWWHLIEARHSNVTNNYALQIAGSFFDQNLYFRKTNNLATTAWQSLIYRNATGNVTIPNLGGNPAMLNFPNLDDGRNTADGITWYVPGAPAYGIYRTVGAWSPPNYQQLQIAFATGIVIDGGTAYGRSGTSIQPAGGPTSTGGRLTAHGNIINDSPSQGWLRLTGDLPGYATSTHPTLKTQSLYIYFSAGGLYSAYMNSLGVFTSVSDRNKKENFVELDLQDILHKIDQLPAYQWNFKGESPSIKHIAPIAQDFYKLFGLNGDNDKMISGIDPAGVALVGIKALSAKVLALENENKAFKARMATLDQGYSEFQARLAVLEKENKELKETLMTLKK